MKHLRVLGSVGEPIAAEVWKWYFEIVGKEESHIVDVCFALLVPVQVGCTDNGSRLTGKQRQAQTS
jgi:acyl-coenzyme A synthetase/AMP-(fatty) acid ligase